jgi:hypothetical protein
VADYCVNRNGFVISYSNGGRVYGRKDLQEVLSTQEGRVGCIHERTHGEANNRIAKEWFLYKEDSSSELASAMCDYFFPRCQNCPLFGICSKDVTCI